MAGNTLGLISVEGEPHWRDLFIGGKSSGPKIAQQILSSKLKSFDLSKLKEIQTKQIEKSEEMLRKMIGRGKGLSISQEDVAKFKQTLERSFSQFSDRIVAAKEGRLEVPLPQAKEPVVSASFSRDGRLLFCTTTAGLRVYEWSTVPRTSGAHLPLPVWRFDTAGDTWVYGATHIHAMAEEVDAAALIFACGSKIHRMDLSSGETRELIQLPGNLTIYQMQVSRDGATLGVASRDLALSASGRSRRAAKQYWEVWSLPRLRGPFIQN
jgi:hypothetical protein